METSFLIFVIYLYPKFPRNSELWFLGNFLKLSESSFHIMKSVERTRIDQLLLVMTESWKLIISIDFGIFFLSIFVFFLNCSSEIKMHLEGFYSLSFTVLNTKQEY